MKRLIAIILMLILAFGAISCGPKKDGKKPGDNATSPISQRDKDLQEAAGE